MSLFPVPHILLESIYELTPAFFTEKGISLLLLDLDNTLAPYSADSPSPELIVWLEGLKDAGIEPFILSNNRGDRPQRFAAALSLDYVGKSRKPSVKKLKAVLSQRGLDSSRAAIIGDQVYTDILCGRRAGVYTIAVRPIDINNPLRALRYFAEMPFRLACMKRGFELTGE